MKEETTWKAYDQALSQREAGDGAKQGPCVGASWGNCCPDQDWMKGGLGQVPVCVCGQDRASQRRPRMSSGKRPESSEREAGLTGRAKLRQYRRRWPS